MPLLQVKDLRIVFSMRNGLARVVDGVSFEVEEGETLGLVGESGSGKSVLSMSILRLLESNGKVESGEMIWNDGAVSTDLLQLPMTEMYKIRGNRISMIFQEPMTALNPVFTVKRQLSEPFLIHRNMTKKQAAKEAEKMLEAVQIPSPKRVLKQYAHQLSGGMRQRVMIAMALACRPKILIADEPTTALDVTVQAQVLKLMRTLWQSNSAILLITHDLGVISQMATGIAVMKDGRVVEKSDDPNAFFADPVHPYSRTLVAEAKKMEFRREN